MQKGTYKNDLPPFLMVSGWFLKLFSKSKYAMFQSDVDTIQSNLSFYVGKNDNALNLAGMVYSRKIAKILIRYLTQYNPGVFDKMIGRPETVTDAETRSHIIAGHLRAHPDAASKVIESFKPSEIDPKVYNTALKYAKRLKDCERCK